MRTLLPTVYEVWLDVALSVAAWAVTPITNSANNLEHIFDLRPVMLTALLAPCSRRKVPGHRGQVANVNNTVAVQVCPRIEFGISCFPAEGRFDNRNILTIDYAIPIHISRDAYWAFAK